MKLRKRQGSGHTGHAIVRRDGRNGIHGYQYTTDEARYNMKEKKIKRSSIQVQRSANNTLLAQLHSNKGQMTARINKNQILHNVSEKVSKKGMTLKLERRTVQCGSEDAGHAAIRREERFKPAAFHQKKKGFYGRQYIMEEARCRMKETNIELLSVQGQRSKRNASIKRDKRTSLTQLHSQRGEEAVGMNYNTSPDNGSEKIANKRMISKREREIVQYGSEGTARAVIGIEGTSKLVKFQRERNGISGDQYVIEQPRCIMKQKNPKLLSVHVRRSAKNTSIEGDRRSSWVHPKSLCNNQSSDTSHSISYNNTEMSDLWRKKKKYAMRLDPYDISNKRLDYGILADESMKTMTADSKKDTKVSMNAQFHAIRPTASIISFVEDNLLGRRRLIDLKRAGYKTELSAPLDNISFSKSLERDRVEESIFRNKLTFFAAAKASSSFPAPDLPEIAFAGRSNVGKSSLLNALTRQWGVARTSDKPGLTQAVNFFKLGPKLCLVDLPGYGFAYAKEEAKEAWEELVKEYVSSRACLKQVCLLVDTKWGMKPRDHELVGLLERSHTKYQIVLTKTDLVFPMDVARRTMQIEESHRANNFMVQPVVMVSSKSGAGIQILRKAIEKITRFAKF